MKLFKNFKKRGLPVLLALILCLSLLPTAALAEDAPAAEPAPAEQPVDVQPVAELAAEESAAEVKPMVAEVTVKKENGEDEVKQFSSIAEAIGAIGGNGTVKLLPQEGADVANPTKITEEVKIEKDQNITLDIPENVRLQNATDGKNETGNTAGRSTIYVLDGGVLTVQGGGAVVSQREAGREGAAWGDGYALYNQSGGKVILLGCTFSNQNTNTSNSSETGSVKRTHYTIFNAGTMEVNGSTIDSDASRNPKDHPEILGQEIKGANTQVVSTGSLTISKVNVTGTMSVGVWNKGGQLVVDDGDFTKWMCVQTSNGATTDINGGNYLTLTDTDTNRLLYTNLGDGTTTMVPTFALQNGKDLNNLDRSKITWTTSDDSIASVDSNGFVTARSNGEVTIVATYTVNGKTVSQEYTVTVGTVYVPVFTEDFVFPPTDASTGTTIADQAVPLAGLMPLAQLLEELRQYEEIEDAELPEDFKWLDHEYAQAIYWGLEEGLVVDTEEEPLDPDEVLTVGLMRGVLTNFVERYLGLDGFAVAGEGEDDEIVFDLGERLTAFYAELEAFLEDKAA